MPNFKSDDFSTRLWSLTDTTLTMKQTECRLKSKFIYYNVLRDFHFETHFLYVSS